MVPIAQKNMAKAARRRLQRKKKKADTKATLSPGNSRGISRNERLKSLILNESLRKLLKIESPTEVENPHRQLAQRNRRISVRNEFDLSSFIGLSRGKYNGFQGKWQ